MKYQSILEWFSTTMLLLGAALTSMNLVPWNLIVSGLGNLGWFVAGVRLQKPSLWSVSLILLVVYSAGYFFAA